MTTNRPLYDTLGVSQDATHEQIRSSYRARARKVHPDNQETGNPVEFARLQLAHATLTNPEARSHYDSTGDETGGVNGRSPSNIEAQAIGLISTLSQQIIDGGFGVDCDLAGKIKDALSISLAGHRTNREAGVKVGAQLKQRIEAVNRRWTGAEVAKSVVVGGLQQRIDATEQQMHALETTIKTWEMAVTLMDGAAYEVPIVKPTAHDIAYITHTWKIGI